MSVFVDSVSTFTGSTSYSYAHTPGGTPTAVLVAVTQDVASRGPAVTYGGTTMFSVGTVSSPDATTTQFLFGLTNPNSGVQNVGLTWTGTTQTDVATITVTGSLLTAGAFGTATTNSGNSGNASGTLTVLTSGSLAVAACGNNQTVSPVAVAWSGASPAGDTWNFRDSGPWQDIAGQAITGGPRDAQL